MSWQEELEDKQAEEIEIIETEIAKLKGEISTLSSSEGRNRRRAQSWKSLFWFLAILWAVVEIYQNLHVL